MPQRIIIARPVILVVDHKGNGRSQGLSLENAREELHTVAFPALGGEPGLPRPAAVQFTLYEIQVYLNSGRTPIDDPSDAPPV